MPITVHYSDGRPPAIMSMKAAFARVTSDIDSVDLLPTLLCGERVAVSLKDGTSAELRITSYADEPFDSDPPREAEQLPLLPRFRYEISCTLKVPLNATVICSASDPTEATRLVEEIMTGIREPRPDFQISVHEAEISALVMGLHAMRTPRDLGAVSCQATHVVEVPRLEDRT
jgi:hypothetical protein